MPGMSTDDDDDLESALAMMAEPEATDPPPTQASQLSAETDDLVAVLDAAEPAADPPPAAPVVDHGNDLDAFMEDAGVQQEREVPDETKPWMKYHEFVLVRTVDEIEAIVDKAIEHGRVALDLETQGLDSRIYFDKDGNPETVHQIVGYCLSVDGHTGYYVPVRHDPKDGGSDLNVPLEGVTAAIKRLCLAAQPVGTPEAVEKDPLSFKAPFERAPQVIIYFWNAQFDQEFLFPVTGIDWWHPDSFEDGMLACYSIYAADKGIGLKPKSKQLLRDPDGNPYEMIELKELFPNGRKIQYDRLAPDEPGCIKYACSDGICTYLLCELPGVVALAREKHGFTYRLEKQVSQAVRTMERPRVKVKSDTIEKMLKEHRAERKIIFDAIQKFASTKGWHNLDPGSPKQLSEFLFGSGASELNITPKPPQNEKSKQYKTDASTLEEMVVINPHAPPILKQIVEFRAVEKVITTYLASMAANQDQNHELRFSFKQTGTGTGRFSAPAGKPEHGFAGVPVHGIPGESALRRVFIAREGYSMAKCDYAAQELRIAANVSGEKVWIKEFMEGDGDLHRITASAFFNKPREKITKDERTKGKCVHPDTLVITGEGPELCTIGSLGFPVQEDTFLDLDVDTPISIFDGQRLKPLKALYQGGVKPLVHVAISGGIVTCTPEHRFKLRDGELVRAGDLQSGMLLEETPVRPLGERDYPELSVALWRGVPAASYPLGHDLAYFSGVYAGDGTGTDSNIRLTHGDVDKIDAYGDPYEEWVQNLEASCLKCGLQPTRKDPATLYLGSRVLAKYMVALGIHGKHKKSLRVPSWVMGSRSAFLHYLGGLFDADGTTGTDHHMDMTTKNFVFGGQLATLMKSVGLSFNVELTYNKTYERYYVRLRLTVGSSWDMRFYLRHKGKLGRLREPVRPGRTKDRFIVSKVIDAGEGPCVDVTVESEAHVYMANGFVTHNTANFALIYGGGPAAIVRATGCDKLEASRRKKAFDKSVPQFAKWVKGQHKIVKDELGVKTALGRWLGIPDAAVQAGDILHGKELSSMDANAIRASCERYSTNYPIQGTGADIMKISMVLLCKDFYKRGWLRTGGDDSVRLLLTIHDEIVFEIRDDRVTEVIPIIVSIMESPDKMARPVWKVPLIVEPLISDSWGGGYDAIRMVQGMVAKEGEVIVNGFLYKSTRKAERDVAGDGEEGFSIGSGDDEVQMIRMLDPAWLRDVTPDEPGALPPEPTKPVVESVAVPASAYQKPEVSEDKPSLKAKGKVKIVVMRVNRLNKQTIKQVTMACIEAADYENGSVLHLMDTQGATLIHPEDGRMINPEELGNRLFNLNLGEGTYFEQ